MRAGLGSVSGIAVLPKRVGDGFLVDVVVGGAFEQVGPGHTRWWSGHHKTVVGPRLSLPVHRRALLSLFVSLPLAGCAFTNELGLTNDPMRISRENRLTLTSRADENLTIRFVVTHVAGETQVDDVRVVEPGQAFTFADAFPRRGSADLVVDVQNGTRFETRVSDYESLTIEIRDAETVEVTDQIVA